MTDLAPILGNTMTIGSIVDILVESLSLQISKEDASTTFAITGLTFMDMVERGWKAHKDSKVVMLERGILSVVEGLIKTRNRTILLFSVHLQAEQHYVGFKVNFQTNEISYGTQNILESVIENLMHS